MRHASAEGWGCGDERSRQMMSGSSDFSYRFDDGEIVKKAAVKQK
jgi:hypothetical protein